MEANCFRVWSLEKKLIDWVFAVMISDYIWQFGVFFHHISKQDGQLIIFLFDFYISIILKIITNLEIDYW